MRPLPSHNTTRRDYYARSPDSVAEQGLEAWRRQKDIASANRLRVPAVFAARRIGLSDTRCQELSERIDSLNHQLLNAPAVMAYEERSDLESRLWQLREALHRERLTLWKDLLPLIVAARDAGVDAMRASWLSEFVRSVNGGEQPSPETRAFGS